MIENAAQTAMNGTPFVIQYPVLFTNWGAVYKMSGGFFTVLKHVYPSRTSIPS